MTTERTPVRFYQVGSFAVGNRLVDLEQRSAQSDPERANSLTSGHRACAGCGEALGARYALDAAMRATNGQLVAANAASVATGVAAGLRAQGRSDVRVVGQGGDGGTADIGFGALSGMFERNDDVLFICYDNQGYMNTGVQRSSATPGAARTATTQAVGPHPGNVFGQGKDMARIAMAHEIPYVATATVADLFDLESKVERAMAHHGARYLHILVPCPLGWGALSSDTIRLARLAHETGIFPVFEAEHGDVVSSLPIRRQVPVEEYLRPQKRFAHLFDKDGSVRDAETVQRLQHLADRNIERYGLVSEEGL